MKKVIFIFVMLLFISMVTILNAQNRDQDQETNVNKEKLLKLADEFHHKFLIKRAEVERVAKEKGWMIREETDQGVREIQYIDIYGMPQYYQTTNLNAARTTNTDDLWVGGSSGLNLSGDGYLIGEWDGGGVLTTHQEFDNGGGTRVTQMDSPGSTHYHSTHVAGTIIAEGQSPTAHGMAPEALLNAYEWTDAETEMSTAAANGLTLSNHSYGWLRGWYYNSSNGYWYWYGNTSISTIEDYLFGFYDESSEDWDQIAINAPHYLIVKSSGNDRNDDYSGNHLVWGGTSWVWSTASRDPDGGTDGYDCIGQQGVAKNVLTVGAVNDIIGGWTSPSDVVMTSFSSWGPTDDGRIKPDIVANGWNLFSCNNTSNSSYMTLPGTSMSAPNVTGTLAVLQDYYEDLRGGTMSAAAIKGLVINTANEAGPNPGPDYMFGWGLLNATGAADLINDDNTEGGLIVEGKLVTGDAHNYTYYCDGSTDINVTLCWTDPAATPLAPGLNNSTNRNVNDLDLKIIDDAISYYYSWRLNPTTPSAAATNSGENERDNVETVNITSPSAGYYTVRVEYEGTLTNSEQAYALIVTGLTTPPTDTYCETRHTAWSSYEYIENVTMGDIDNTTGRSPGGYHDYTGLVASINKGSSQTINVTINGYSGDQGRAWVDWNQDGDFSDAGEEFVLGSGAGPVYSTSITAPSGAASGYTTMRVCLTYNTTPTACGTFSYGETEDYALYVVGTPGLWTGLVSTNWNVAGNWDDLTIPTSTVNVTIPSGTPHQPTIGTGTTNEYAYCDNLTIQSGAVLTQTGTTTYRSFFHVNGNFNSDAGTFTQNSDYAFLYLEGSDINSSWDDDNEDDTYTMVRIVKTGTNTLSMWQNMTVKNLEVREGNFRIDASWTLTVTSALSYAFQVEAGGILTLTAGKTIDVTTGDVEFANGSQANVSGGLIRCGDEFRVLANAAYDIQFTGGTVEMYGSSAQNIEDQDGNTEFYDLIINKSSGTCTIDGGDLDVRNDLEITSGSLTLNGYTVDVANNVHNYGELTVDGTLEIGNDFYLYSGSIVDLSGTIHLGILTGWHGSAAHYSGSTFNQTGGDYYVESIALLNGSQFNGTGGTTHMYVDGYASTNTIEIDDPDSYFYNFLVDSGASAALYNCSNNLTAYYTILNGSLDINSYTMNATYFDVHDELIIDSGGTVNVTGNGPYFSSGGSLTMISGSELNSEQNIRFYTGSTENVSGGEIYISEHFSDYNEIFSPTGGSVIFDGSSASSVIGPTAFYDLNINKTGATVTANSSFSMTNNLNIASGALTLNGNTVDVANDVDVYGTLNMTNAADILNVGDAAYDNLAFYSGSFGNLTAGVVNLSSWVYIPSGGLLTATTGNTMNFNGPSIAGIDIRESGSVFGNINIISVSPFRFYSIGGHTIEIDGDFDLQAGNTMELMNNTVVVHGNFTDAATSIIYVYDGPVDGGNRNLFSANGNVENQNDISIIENSKNSQDSRSRGGYFEIDTNFTLTGLMDVDDGDVLVHGEFELATTGTLTIDGGSFINDESTRDRAWRYLRGTFNLSDGLFEITNNSTNFASTATTNISGGTIRTGGAFYGVHTGTFQPTGGIVEIIGGAGDNAVYCSNGNYFYDLVINRNLGIYTALMQETHVQNDLTINSGILRSYDDLYVGGNWTNNVGPGGFLPYTHTVIFNGTGDVSITPGETFYNLTLDKVSSADWLNIYGDLTIGNDLTINPGALYSGDNTISVSGNVAVNSGGCLYMQANSTLELGDASSLNVHSGGWLYTVGSSGNYATVTHVSTGSYSFSIWGSIGAQYAIFEYMSADGVNVKTTGYVHSTFTFNNCTFRNGISGGTLLTINNNLALTIDNATFPTNTWSGTYNVSKTQDQGSLTFTNATGDFAGPNYENDTFNRIGWDGFAPDLDITNVNWTDTNPYVCDMITVSITVYNNGNVDIPGGTGFYVDLYHNLGSPPAPLETGDQYQYISSGVPAGDFMIVDFDVVNDVAESWSSYVQVDTDEEITELNEGNNVWGPDAVTWNPFPVIDDLTIQYNVGTNEVELNWSYPITVDQYKIYRSTDPYDFAGADVFTSSTESYSETALGTKYFYHVTAERTCTASDNSYKEKTERSRKR